MQRADRSESRLVKWGAIAAMVGGAAYVLKVTTVFVQDGRGGGIVGILYLLGALVPLFAAVGVAAKLASKWYTRIAVGLGVALLHLMYIMGLSEAVEAAVGAITGGGADSYVAEETPLLLLGLVWLIVGYRMFSKTEPGHSRATPETA
jgi:hypothetical protein